MFVTYWNTKHKAFWFWFFLVGFGVGFFVCLFFNYYYLIESRLGFLNSKRKPLWCQVRHPAGRQMQHWSFTSFWGTLNWEALAEFPPAHRPLGAQLWGAQHVRHGTASSYIPHSGGVRSAGVTIALVAWPRDAPHWSVQTLLWVLRQVNL